MQSLGFSPRVDLERYGDAEDGAARVGMLFLAVKVGCCLVDELGGKLVDDGIDEPLFACSLTARNQTAAAAGLRWEEIALNSRFER